VSQGTGAERDQVTTPIEDRDDRHHEFASDTNKCQGCGEPIENVRATCPNCGRDYAAEDYDDDRAGKGFVAGTHVDDDGNELQRPVLEPEEDDEDASSSSSSSSDPGPPAGAEA